MGGAHAVDALLPGHLNALNLQGFVGFFVAQVPCLPSLLPSACPASSFFVADIIRTEICLDASQ